MTTRPVPGQSSKCPFKGQVENSLLLKCREKRHLTTPPHPLNQRDLKFNPPDAGRCRPGIRLPPVHTPVGSARHFEARG